MRIFWHPRRVSPKLEMHSWYYEIRVCEWGGVEWEKILALWSIFIMLVWHVLMLFCAIFAFFFKPLLQPFNFDKKYKRTKIHVERSVVDNVVVSHYVPKLNERLVQYSSTIVPIFIVSALVDASFSYKDTWNYNMDWRCNLNYNYRTDPHPRAERFWKKQKALAFQCFW